jgi:hypothetical protein
VPSDRLATATSPDRENDRREEVEAEAAPTGSRIGLDRRWSVIVGLAGGAVGVALAATGHAWLAFAAASGLFALSISGRASALELLPVGAAITLAGTCVAGVLAEWFDADALTTGRARAVLAVLCAVGAAGVLARRGVVRPRLVSWSALAVTVAIVVLLLALGGLGWVTNARTLLSWFVQGGDHIGHTKLAGGVLRAGHPVYTKASFANGYPLGLHFLSDTLLVADGGKIGAEATIDRLATTEAVCFLLFVVSSCMVTLRLLRSAAFGVLATVAGSVFVAVLLIGRPFATYTLSSGFLTTIAGAWLLAAATQVLVAFRRDTHVTLRELAVLLIALAGTWQLLVLPVAAAIVCVVVADRPRMTATWGVTAIVMGLCAPFALMPLLGAYWAHAGDAFSSAGASYPLPTTHLLFAGVATIAVTLVGSTLQWPDRWRSILMPGLLGLAALVATVAMGEGPDGQLSYYPKKLSFHAMALLVPVVGFWFAAALDILGRAVVPRAAWVAPVLGVISVLVVADYVGYLHTYQQLADGEPGIGLAQAGRVIAATDQLRGNLAPGTGVAVIGSDTPYHDRELTGIVAGSLSRDGPALFTLYDSPGFQERCTYLARDTSLVVIDVGASATDLGCLAQHPELRVVRP